MRMADVAGIVAVPTTRAVAKGTICDVSFDNRRPGTIRVIDIPALAAANEIERVGCLTDTQVGWDLER